MIQVPRDDRSLIGQWWWTVDRWALGAVLAIMAFGVMLTLAASPPAAWGVMTQLGVVQSGWSGGSGSGSVTSR